MAHFPWVKTISDFDFSFQPSVDEKKIRELANLRFVERAEVVLFTGPPGVGKTHLAISLGLEAIRAGYSVYFTTLSELADQVPRDRANPRWVEKLRVLSYPRLLIIDEVGYVPLDSIVSHFVFTLVCRRYEKGAMIWTSNKGLPTGPACLPATRCSGHHPGPPPPSRYRGQHTGQVLSSEGEASGRLRRHTRRLRKRDVGDEQRQPDSSGENYSAPNVENYAPLTSRGFVVQLHN